MKQILSFFLLISACTLNAQSIDDYFEKIRSNEAMLTAFIAQMPKGGDLHNHYTGAVYAETYWRWITEKNYCLNKKTLDIAPPDINANCDSGYSSLSSVYASGQSEYYRGLVIRDWSSKDYDQVHSDTRENQFFNAFGKFWRAADLNYDQGLNELKNRAKKENVSYIELMFRKVPLQITNSIFDKNDSIKQYNLRLSTLGQNHDLSGVNEMLGTIFAHTNQLMIKKAAAGFSQYLDSLHTTLHLDDKDFTMRYLTYVTRVQDPVPVFINLLAQCEAAHNSRLISGVNILAPEDNEVSMRDYWLHMQMFAWCHQLYPDIKFAMHAGELTEGAVPPEDLTFHINDAVHIAGAKRIGHGVDIAYENNCYDLLRFMSRNGVDVEINLSSNEFILGVAYDRHPIMLYKQFHVPITISTDDAGISRTSLTEQFVLLAKRYKDVTYRDMKTFVYNSIQYSFIKEPKVLETMKKDLDARFTTFEKYIMEKKP